MKKILFILLAIICIPVSSFAISLSTLQNNPEKYLKISEDYEYEHYLDLGSVKSIRYSPPYYTISANTYTVDYESNLIFSDSNIYNYDYNYSRKLTRIRIISEMNEKWEPLNEEIVKSRVEEALHENSGISSTVTLLADWAFDGRLIKRMPPNYTFHGDTHYGTPDYCMANAVYKAYYNQDF